MEPEANTFFHVSLCIAKVNDAISSIQNDEIKSVAEVFRKNILRVQTTVSLPTAGAEAVAGFEGLCKIIWQLWKSEDIQSKYEQRCTSKVFDVRLFVRLLYEKVSEISDESQLARLCEMAVAVEGRKQTTSSLLNEFWKVESIRDWFFCQLSNAIAMSWTAFEYLVTDLWVQALNLSPEKFNKLVRHPGAMELPDGLTNKQISISLLAKYQFDLRGRLGELLKPKFDLTSLKNIKTAYVAAFGDVPETTGAFDSDGLSVLEACRHVIVHRAGVIDEEFMARTKNISTPEFAEGEPLPLTGQWVSELVNAGIESGCKVIEMIDAQFSPSAV